MRIQKVKHLKDELAKKKPNIASDYMVSVKLDGWYVYIDFNKYTGWTSPMSSTGRVIPSMVKYKKDFEKLGNPRCNTRIIAEAILPDTPFHILNGVFNRSKRDCFAEGVEFCLHDMINKEAPIERARVRFNRLMSSVIETSTIKVHSLLCISSSQEEWRRCFDLVVENGGEGIVLKQATGLYYPGKRNSSLMKMKQEYTGDFKIVDWFSTYGAKGNKAWNLTVERVNGYTQKVVVAKHSLISEFNLNSPIGKVAEIKAMKELEGGALREPMFKCIREDKTLADLVD